MSYRKCPGAAGRGRRNPTSTVNPCKVPGVEALKLLVREAAGGDPAVPCVLFSFLVIQPTLQLKEELSLHSEKETQ